MSTYPIFSNNKKQTLVFYSCPKNANEAVSVPHEFDRMASPKSDNLPTSSTLISGTGLEESRNPLSRHHCAPKTKFELVEIAQCQTSL